MTYQRQNSAQIPGGQGGGQDRQYVGKGKWIDFKNGGGKFRIALTPEGIELIFRNQNSSGWANLCMSEMRTPDRQGNQYTLYLDDFVPQKQGGNTAPRPGQYHPSAPQGDRRYNDGGFGGTPEPQDHRYGPEDEPEMQSSCTPQEIEDDIPF